MKTCHNTAQLDLWTSSFGSDYTSRNDKQRPNRIKAWERMLSHVEVSSILEVGCNAGWNLNYIQQCGDFSISAIEPQQGAVELARERAPYATIRQANAFALPFADNTIDLVFTSGVLIHIHPTDLVLALDEMYRVSRRFILYCEYDDDQELEVSYRGHQAALWRRNHLQVWRTRYPNLSVVAKGHWDAEYDYDQCSWAILEKP